MRFPTFCCVETRYISKSMPHSHSRMVEARKEAHAYCFEFGKPTFFVTISKLDSACIEIKWLSNEDCEDVTPSKTFRYNLLAMFPGAAALSSTAPLLRIITYLETAYCTPMFCYLPLVPPLH